MTVFLTTQYLEEADKLADRVAIIDHGKIVAEGTPDALKARDRAAQRRGRAADAGRPRPRSRGAGALRRDGAGARPRRVAVRLDGGAASLADVVRALDAEGVAVAHLQLHAPCLDDVFLAKTGRSLEGAGDERPRRSRAAAPA